MSREKFLKTLQYFDDHFNVITKGDNEISRDMDSRKNELKKDTYFQVYNRIDVSKVRQITQRDDNCFAPFYDLEDDLLYYFFEQLSNIELGLIYLNDFSDNYRDKKVQNRNGALQKKIDAVLEYARETKFEKKTLKDLESMKSALDNRHFTERQLFQHLLFWVALMLNDLKQSRKVSDVTNCLIKEYFSCDVTFSRAEDINKYEPFTYYYYDAKGILLRHS